MERLKRAIYATAMNARIMKRPLVIEERRINFEESGEIVS